jgi:hypothetical protein
MVPCPSDEIADGSHTNDDKGITKFSIMENLPLELFREVEKPTRTLKD